MTEKNRFGDIFSDIESANESEAPKPTKNRQAQRKPKTTKQPAETLPKYKDPNYIQVGLYLPKNLHQQLKIGSAITEKELSDIAAEALGEWVKKHVPKMSK